MPAPLGSLKTAVGLIFGLLFVIALAQTAWSGTPEHVETIQNETIEQDVGNWTAVNAASETAFAGAYDNETVYNSSGVELVEGTDYEWNASTGRIKFHDTTSTSDGSTADITYSYDAKSDEAANWHGPVAAVLNVLPVLAFGGAFVMVAGVAVWAVRTTKSMGGGR